MSVSELINEALTGRVRSQVKLWDDKEPEMHMTDVVIPARNEESTITGVVTAWRCSPFTGSIIVVCNRCEDETAQMAMYAGALVLEWNREDGKGQALQYGLDYVETQRVAFCDSDLSGVKPGYVSALLGPHEGMIIGVPEYPKLMPVPWIVPYNTWREMSGIRALPTTLARKEELHGYTVETVLNNTAKAAGIPIVYQRWKGVYGKIRNNEVRMTELRRDREWLDSHYGKGKRKSH